MAESQGMLPKSAKLSKPIPCRHGGECVAYPVFLANETRENHGNN
jgi:hypothetical protein